MPGGPFTAIEELKVLCDARAELEEALIKQLVGRDAERIKSTEEEIQKIDLRCNEIKMVLGYDQDVVASQIAVPDLWRVVFHSDRSASAPDQSLAEKTVVTDPAAGDPTSVEAGTAASVVSLGLEEFSVDVGRWSVANTKRRITSGIIATGSAFFGVVEGPKAAVIQLMDSLRNDRRHKNFVVIHEAKIDSRAFLRGCQLSCVPDGLLAHVLDRMRAVSTSASRYAPREVVDLARRGGHPLGFAVTEPKQMIVWTCMLDVKCGAVHRAPRYQEAAVAATSAVQNAGGVVIETFGEFMSAIFPLVGGSTAAAAAANAVNAAVPFAVQSIVLDTAVVVNQPSVVAFGSAFKKGKALLILAEKTRRPVIITYEAGAHCNRAKQPLESFTNDCVNYFTLAGLGMTRLENPPEPELIGPYNPGPEPAEEKPRTMPLGAGGTITAESTAFVRGALTSETLAELFRRIDVGGVGWIGKDAFRRAVKSDPDFPKLIDELAEKAFEGWLARCNKAGDSRVNFHEFATVCLKLVHAT